MKIPANILLPELVLLISLPGLFLSYSYGKKSDLADDCEARCAAMDGENKYRCMKTCVNTKRKNEPVGKENVKERMDTCENACADFTGVDRIRCIRICLDSKTERTNIKKDDLKKEKEDPCETRCAVLTGVSKHQCIARCQRETRYDQRDATPLQKK